MNQSVHPGGALGGEVDELIGVRVQLSLIAFRDQLRIEANHPQWFLQIMTGGIGELAQILVGAPECRVRTLQCFLGQAPVCDIYARSDVALKLTRDRVYGPSVRQYPAPFTVVPPQPVV